MLGTLFRLNDGCCRRTELGVTASRYFRCLSSRDRIMFINVTGVPSHIPQPTIHASLLLAYFWAGCSCHQLSYREVARYWYRVKLWTMACARSVGIFVAGKYTARFSMNDGEGLTRNRQQDSVFRAVCKKKVKALKPIASSRTADNTPSSVPTCSVTVRWRLL